MQYANSVFETLMRHLVAPGIFSAAKGHMSEDNVEEEIRFPAVNLSHCLVVSHRSVR